MKKILALLLAIVMMFGSVPVSAADARDTGNDEFYKIVHLDAARKYFSLSQVKDVIDNCADAGMNQLQFYFSDNQGLRLALDDMTVTTAYGTYDLTDALGGGYEQPGKGMYPQDGGTKDAHLNQQEMTAIIEYAKSKGIEIVPSFNSPGHMGALLEEFPQFCYRNNNGTTKSSIDLRNEEAVAFGLAVVKLYANYFASQGVKFFNIGGDEYANDLTSDSNGFSVLINNGLYDDFVSYLNHAAQIVLDNGMTPRMFNDGAYFGDNFGPEYQLNDAIQICYWSTNGFSDAATPAEIAAQGHQLINTHKDLYYVVAKSPWTCVTEESAANFDKTVFFGGNTIADPAGTMLCIWCDDAREDTMTADQIISNTKGIFKVYGNKLPSSANVVTSLEGVSFAANQLETFSVEESGVPTGLTDVASGRAISYTLTAKVSDDTAYTGPGAVTIPVPAEWNGSRVLGFIVDIQGNLTQNIEGTYSAANGIARFLGNGTYTMELPHLSEVAGVGVYQATVAATYGGEIRLAPGESYELDDAEGEVSSENPSIANITGNASAGQSAHKVTQIVSGQKYYIANVANTSNGSSLMTATADSITVQDWFLGTTYRGMQLSSVTIDGDTIRGAGIIGDNLWTVTKSSTTNNGQYYVQNTSGQYLTIGGSRSVTLSNSRSTVLLGTLGSGYQISNTNKSYSLNYFESNGEELATATSYTTGQNNTDRIWNFYSPVAETKLTITAGNQTGRTTVWVGDTYYDVIVEDLDDTVTLRYYISSFPVWEKDDTVDGSNPGNKPTMVQITAQEANSVEGLSIYENNKAPANGEWRWASPEAPTLYWKSTLLRGEENWQTKHDQNIDDNGDYNIYDMSLNGTDFTHIRYYGGLWQVKTSEGRWVDVTAEDELVAYYLMKTQTTEEVATYVKDWAFTANSNTNTEMDRHQKALSFAVVYPDGQLKPTEEDIYENSTLVYWDNLDNLGLIFFREVFEDYHVSHITYTLGHREEDKGTHWTSDESIVWEKENGWYDETTVWEASSGTNPVVDGRDLIDVINPGQPSGNHTTASGYDGSWGDDDAVLLLIYLYVEGNLNIRYVDDSTGEEFYQWQISTKDENATFNNVVKTENGKMHLQKDATIENRLGVQETIETDLLKMSQLEEHYRSGLYEYKYVEVSEDGTILTIHYNYNLEKPLEFVVDFGLPVTADLNNFYRGRTISNITVTGETAYGAVSVDGTNITYTPERVMKEIEKVLVTTSFEETRFSEETRTIRFIPATTVYYEEGFAEFGTADTSEGVSSGWTGGSKGNDVQQASVPGETTDFNNSSIAAYNYGYDSAYDSSYGSVIESENLITSEILTASSVEDDLPRLNAAKAGDGNIDTQWSSKSICGKLDKAELRTAPDEYLKATFDEAQEIKKVKITFHDRSSSAPGPSNMAKFNIKYKKTENAEAEVAKTYEMKRVGTENSDGYERTAIIVFDRAVSAKELILCDFEIFAGQTKWNSIGISEFEAYSETIVDGEYSEAVSTKEKDTATIEFAGTGIEIYTNNTPNTGNVIGYLYEVVTGEDGETSDKLKGLYSVDTMMKDGEQPGTTSQAVAAYNVPIINIRGLAHGNYKIVLRHIVTVVDKTNNLVEPVKLDGFRVIGTLPMNHAAYTADGEANPEFVELRDATLHANLSVLSSVQEEENKEMYAAEIANGVMSQVNAYSSKNGIVIKALVLNNNIVEDSEVLSDLVDNGPKNEIYLQRGQSLVFKINAKDAQIGLKALDSATGYIILKDGTNIASKDVFTSSTDMYYDLQSDENKEITYTITNTGTGILSVTLLKLFEAKEVAPLTSTNLIPALERMGYAAAKVPEGVTPDSNPETEVCKVFADVEHGAWYEASVQYVYDEGIIVGEELSDGVKIFAPRNNATRAMIAVILYRLEGSPKVTDYTRYNQFTDLPAVEAGFWYTDAVAWALNTGVSTGDDYNMLYTPNAPVTREQLALFLWRYEAKYGENNVTVSKTESELFGTTYVNGWAKEGFAWAVDKNIIKGAEVKGSDGNVYYDLNPQGAATRAQVARVFHRYLTGVTE